MLFLLFPRVQGPLWGLPQDAYAGMTGLSDSMAPGNLSSLAQSDAIAFRAEFVGEAPPHAQRYWRGPVLWDFDGRTWTMMPAASARFRPAERRQALPLRHRARAAQPGRGCSRWRAPPACPSARA